MQFALDVCLALAFWFSAVSWAGAQDRAPDHAPSLVRAAAGVISVNGLAWAYNRYVQHWDWARVGPETWWQNLRSGFQWDDDALLDNQLAHPLQGGFYFNSARGAGLSFWASAPFVAIGSLTWEFFAENVQASPNDVINTTLGGIALGEVTSRVARLLARPGGKRRFARRVGAMAIDPVGRVQGWRLARRGDIQGNEQLRAASWLAFGGGHIAPDPTGSVERYRFLQLGLRYGSAFDRAAIRPFDAFDFDMELAHLGSWQVRQVHVTGLLARSVMHTSAAGDLGLGLFQHYEFVAHPMVMSGQSLSGALLYRRSLGRETECGLDFHLEAVILSEIASEQGHVRRRDYDYAPGFGGRFGAAIRRGGRDLIAVQTRATWLYSVYGADAQHLILTTRAVGTIPLHSAAALGGEARLTFRRSTYPDAVVHRRFPEIRAYVAWPAF